MLPVEPRLKPLGTTFVECENIKDRKMVRSHSFSGYVPYYLKDDDEEEEEAPTPRKLGEHRANSEGSTNTGPNSDNESGTCSPTGASASPSDTGAAWPDTDDEWEGCNQPTTGIESTGDAYIPCVWPDTDDEFEGPSEPTSPLAQPAMPLLAQAAVAPARAVNRKVIVGLGKALAQAAEEGSELEVAAPTSCFSVLGEHGLSIQEYLWRLQRCGCSEDCFVLSLAYISRAAEMNPGKVEVTLQTVHRLLLTALSVAAKFHDRNMCSNQLFAEASGLASEELEKLQAKFLELLGWNLSIEEDTFKRIHELLRIASA